MSPKHFYATDACIGCKRCERKLSGREYYDGGTESLPGNELHRLPGMLSCVSSASGAV